MRLLFLLLFLAGCAQPEAGDDLVPGIHKVTRACQECVTQAMAKGIGVCGTCREGNDLCCCLRPGHTCTCPPPPTPTAQIVR